MFGGFHALANDLPSSHTVGNFAPWVSMNATIVPLSSGSSSDTPMISRPLCLYFTYRSWSFGNDFLQGSQKVPQKSTRTTFPLRLESEIFSFLPFMVVPEISGAGLPTSS